MRIGRSRISLAQLMLLVALAAIAVRTTILLARSKGEPVISVSAIAFSPRGDKLAATVFGFTSSYDDGHNLGADPSYAHFLLDADDWSLPRLLDQRQFKYGPVMRGFVAQSGQYRSIAFSLTGNRLATASDDEAICLWDTVTERKTQNVQTIVGSPRGLCWDHDGRLICGDGCNVYALKPLSNTFEQLASPKRPLTACVTSHDGSRLVVADTEGGVDAYDGRTGAHLHSLQQEANFHTSAAISSDGKFIAANGDSNRGNQRELVVHLWDGDSGEQLRDFELQGRCTALEFSPDGKTLALAEYGGHVNLFPVGGGPEDVIHAGDYITSIAFSPDGRRLAIGEFGGRLSLWDVQSKQLLKSVQLYHESWQFGWPALIACIVTWLIAWRWVRSKAAVDKAGSRGAD